MKITSNIIHLIGNIGCNPELKQLENGKKHVTVSLATNEYFKDKNGKRVVKITQWHRIVAWNKKAEQIQKLMRVGSRVAIIGKLKYRKYKDKDGQYQIFTQVWVEDFKILGGIIAEA